MFIPTLTANIKIVILKRFAAHSTFCVTFRADQLIVYDLILHAASPAATVTLYIFFTHFKLLLSC
jgi:hypothetical protein